jgi:prepilin-type N-terminal cleavage/methylation domain-containing protein
MLSFCGCKAGFTFNEILVAMSLVAIGILSYALGTVGVIRAGATNNNFTVAVNLAQEKIERLRSVGRLSDGSTCPAAGDRGLTPNGTAGGRFDRCWIITSSPLGTMLKQVTVKVSWQDHERRELTITTLVFTG